MIVDNNINFEKFAFGPYATNCYVISEKNASIVIDAPPNSYCELSEKLRGRDIHLFLTHGHWDHMTDASKFQQSLNAKVYANDGDAFFFEEKNKNFVFVPRDVDWHGVKIDKYVADGEELSINGIDVKILHTPGHTEGQIAIYVKNLHSIFVGDTIFSNGVGRTDLPGGNLEKLLSSIREKIFKLPEDTVIYSGHGAETTILKRKK